MPQRVSRPPYTLIEMLRLIPRSSLPIGVAWNKCEEAADRIEELEAALKDMAKYIWRGDWDKLKPETKKVLGEQK